MNLILCDETEANSTKLLMEVLEFNPGGLTIPKMTV